MRRSLVLITFLILSLNSYAQFSLSLNERYIVMDTTWFVHPGDLKDAYKRDLDLKGWKEIDSTYEAKTTEKVIWYRNYFSIPKENLGMPLTIRTFAKGSNKIYIDGQLVQTVGPERSMLWNYVVPVVYVPSNDSLHYVAVRSERSNVESMVRFDVADHPSVMLIPYNSEIRRDVLLMTLVTGFMTFLVSAFLILAFFHLILFLFYKEEKSNLFLGLFCLVFGSFFFVSMGRLVTGNESTFHQLFKAVEFLLPLLNVFLLGLFHTVFYGRLKKFFWISLIGITFLRLLEHYHVLPPFSGLLSFAVFVEIIRIVIVSARKRKPGSRIIGLGLLITIISVPLIIVGFIHSRTHGLTSSDVWVMLGILGAIALLLLSIPLTMSFHFASNFARTNRDLKLQISQVKELSDITIRQEQEKKMILEEQKQVLEHQVEERTRELVLKKKELEEKNTSITDSINYAKKIQRAILHNEPDFQKLFEDSFILFLPKDIVSGDFYWFHKKNKYIYIVAADCTGHGVPGAFMSMIGNTILNDIINDNAAIHPAEVLEQLNDRVREILKQDQDGSETRDGMDITFARFDPATKELRFASALRPVYIIRNGSLIEIKPDKFSIGGYQKDQRAFTENMYQLEKDDRVYFFSDGYADQFGGEKGKKFMIRNFQKLLLQNHMLPMSEQRERLNEMHLQWKGNQEQIDDILVMGFAIN
jgi:serine phosphatase RsbU (regulator of sigma subunit)